MAGTEVTGRPSDNCTGRLVDDQVDNEDHREDVCIHEAGHHDVDVVYERRNRDEQIIGQKDEKTELNRRKPWGGPV